MERRQFLKGAAAALSMPFIARIALAEEGGQPQKGGTLTFAVTSEPPTYDLHATSSFAVTQRVSPHYSMLVHYDGARYPEIVGDLAESWEIAGDQLSVTFKLRQNVKFHDGSPFTSEDVKVSYERMRNPPEGVVTNRQAALANIDMIETLDAHTVVFKLKQVDASVMFQFASPQHVIYSAAMLAKDPNYPVKTVMGTGPFRFVEFVAGSHWAGERFDGYFVEGLPYLDGFRAISMAQAATVNAMAGEQILAQFRGFSPPERDNIVSSLGDKSKVLESSWLLHQSLAFNTQKAPFDDPRVRRALSLAIDRWGGSASLRKISSLGDVGGVVRPGSSWSASEAEMETWPGFGRDIEANREEARRLLKEAGHENLTFKLTNRNNVPYTTTGVFLIDQWRQIGVKVEHQLVELSAWFSAVNSGNYEVGVNSFGLTDDDPNSALSNYISFDRSPLSISRITDRELDDLYDKQSRATNPEERLKLIRSFEERLMQEAYSVPVMWWQRIVVLNSRVQGWPMSPSHLILQDLAGVWLMPEA